MLATHQSGGLQRPEFSVLRMHQQVLLARYAVLTMKSNDHMQALAPGGSISYREF